MTLSIIKLVTLLLVTVLTASLVTASGLQITGVYYDPIQAENGGEAVQLENNGPTPVILDNATLLTKSSSIVLPRATLLPGQGYLVADAGWSTLRDNVSWPLADYEISMSLANTAGSVELLLNNVSQDSLTWNSSQKAREGFMFTHTGERVPSFRNSTSIATNVPITIIVANAPPEILDVQITDDAQTQGIQLLSYNRTIFVTVIAREPNGEPMTGTVDFLGHEEELVASDNFTNGTTSNRTFTAAIPFDAPLPGRYTLVVHMNDPHAESTVTQDITVLSTTSIFVDGNLTFAGLPGTYVTSELRIVNSGNTARTITVSDEDNSIICADTPLTLAAGAEQNITCSVTIPTGEPRTIEKTARIIAT